MVTRRFVDQSTPGSGGAITDWDFDFGNGQPHATGPGPWESDFDPGDYTATLVVTSPDGTDEINHSFTITETSATAPVAAFTFTVDGLDVTFEDASVAGSSGPITDWDLDFGDGSSHATSFPVTHSYADGGTYHPVLEVTGTGSDGTDTQTATVSVSAPSTTILEAAFTWSANGLTVTFHNHSIAGSGGAISAYHWDLGDGSTSTAANPSHTYAAGGDKTVELQVTSPDGTATVTHTVTVSVTTSLEAGFTFVVSNLSVSFSDTSTPGPSGPITSRLWEFGDGATSTATNPTHAYSTAGSKTVKLTVTGTSPDGVQSVSHSVTVTASGGGGSPAAFPSILRASGRNIVDANGHVMSRLKGFNIQTAGWSFSNFQTMYNMGARVLRTMVFWDQIEPSAGSIDMAYVTGKLDPHIANAKAAGLYNQLCLYFGPQGVHCPGWVGGSAASHYVTHGHNVTQFLANRYGNPSSPQYNKSVIGLGLNELTPDSSSGSTWLTTLFTQQKSMVDWMRALAPDWIAFISAGYGAFAPKPNVVAAGHNSDQTFQEAPLHLFDNYVMDLHVYAGNTTSTPTKPVWDGRGSNGSTPHPPIVNVDTSGFHYPNAGTRTQCQQFLKAFCAPHKAFCADADVPLSCGEWGWVHGMSGGVEYAEDLGAALVDAQAAFVMQWDWNSGDKWGAQGDLAVANAMINTI